MKRKTIIIVLAALLLLSLAMAVSAQTNPRPVTEDTYWYILADPGTVNGSGANIQAEGSESACNLSKAGLLKWNVAVIEDSATVGNAKITLNNLISIQGTGDTSVIALFEAPDTWDETTTQGSLPTPPDHNTATPLATTNGPFTVGGDVVFEVLDNTSDPLIQYIQSQIGVGGDNAVSFWVEITDGCAGGGSGRIVWNSREAGTSTMELSTPTNVTLSSLSADTQPVNYALYAGLAALAVIAIGAVGYGYSRTR